MAQGFQTTTGPDGCYSLLLPGEYLNRCMEVTLHAWATGYYSFAEVILVADLRAQPERDIGLWPMELPMPTDTSTSTELPSNDSVFLPIVLRGYPSASPSPTPTRTVTPTPGATPTATFTPTVTPTQQPLQLIVNPSFETDEAWVIPRTVYPAGYSVSRAHTGARSMRLGLAPGGNLYSYSSVQQTVEIPNWATRAELSFYYFPLMALDDGDRIYFCVLRASDNTILQWSFWTDAHQAWNLRTFELRDYAGQRIKVHFGVRNDGLDGITAVYLDDVELWVY